MAAPIDVGIAPFLELSGGYTIRFTAFNASTGVAVTDVVISGATVQYDPEPPESPLPAPLPVFYLPGPVG